EDGNFERLKQCPVGLRLLTIPANVSQRISGWRPGDTTMLSWMLVFVYRISHQRQRSEMMMPAARSDFRKQLRLAVGRAGGEGPEIARLKRLTIEVEGDADATFEFHWRAH